MENETVFKRIPQLSIDMFIKYLFPEKLRGAQNIEDRGASESSGSENESVETSTGGIGSRIRMNAGKRNVADTSSYGGTSISGSLKS